MSAEETPNGRIIRHASGGRIVQDKNGVCHAYDAEGNKLGSFKEVADAGRALHAAYDKAFDASVEGKDLPVPHTEVPPARQAYIDRNAKERGYGEKGDFIEGAAGGKQKIIENSIVLIDRILNVPDHLIGKENKEILIGIKESIEEEGFIKASDLSELVRISKVNIVHDTSRLPYYNYDYFIDIINEFSKLAIKRFGKEYDRLYPLEVKSSLKDNVAQILQDYPNASPQILKKKLLTYGSRGKKFYTEAQDIGFIKWLDEQTKKTTSVRRVLDPVTGKPTGDTFLHERGVSQEGISHDAVMEYLTQHEVKIGYEVGAEADLGDTSGITVGGARTDYKETAVRINPEYSHGVKGHYGESIVHFRTETRLSSEGDKHKYIPEVQAQNSDGASKITKEQHAENKAKLKAGENELNFLKKHNLFKEGKDITVNNFIESGFEKDSTEAALVSYAFRKMLDGIVKPDIGSIISFVEKKTAIWETLDDSRKFDVEHAWRKCIKKFNELQELNKKYHEVTGKKKTIDRFWEDIVYSKDYLIERVSDLKTKVQRFEKQSKGSPLTDPQSTALIALKGIIRESIIDGIDNITLTHPMDAPMASHMNQEKSKAFYGKLVPDTWNAWLKRFGIEGGQMNKLKNPTIEEAQSYLDKVSGKVSEQSARVMERFKEIHTGEDPSVIQKVSEVLQETPENFLSRLDAGPKNIEIVKEIVNKGINDNSLKEHIIDLINLKEEQSYRVRDINDLRNQTVSQLAGGSVSNAGRNPEVAARVSAEAIDRGFTFRLNDRIKADFLAGKIDIYSQPTQGGMASEGGRSYSDRQLERNFIGKYAEQNKEILKGLSIEYIDRLGDEDPEYGGKQIYIKKNGEVVGSIKFYLEDNSFYVNSNKSISGKFVQDISVKVKPEYQGNKYQHLLYSEMFERARSLGAIAFRQEIENKLGLPLKSTNKIVGKDGSVIWTLAEHELQSPTQENFDRMMSNAPSVKSNYISNVPHVSHFGELDPNAHYQPAEQWKSETTSVGQVIKNSAGWVIIKATNKYRLYSPTHALIGIYNDPEQAKRKARASK